MLYSQCICGEDTHLIPQYKKELILAGEPELAKKVMDIREENQIFEL